MAIDLKLIDKLLADYKRSEDIIGENGLLKQLTKALLERAMQAELTEHLGYEKHDPAGHEHGRDPGAPGRVLQSGGKSDADFQRHRGGDEEGQDLADPSTGFSISDRIPGRLGGEDSRDGPRNKAIYVVIGVNMQGNKE